MSIRTRSTLPSDADALSDPLDEVVEELRQWRKHGHWWEPESEARVNALTVPGDTGRDWERSFRELAHLIFGGLRIEAVREALTEDGVPFKSSEEPLALLRKIVASRESDGAVEQLRGLGIISTLEAAEEPGEGSAAHFAAVAEQVEAELKAITRALDHRYRYLAAKYG